MDVSYSSDQRIESVAVSMPKLICNVNAHDGSEPHQSSLTSKDVILMCYEYVL